jgi:hypothetical protein
MCGPFGFGFSCKAVNEISTDLQEDRQSQSRAVAARLGHTKRESTVGYLGIEVDDALSISEQVEL